MRFVLFEMIVSFVVVTLEEERVGERESWEEEEEGGEGGEEHHRLREMRWGLEGKDRF